MEHNISNYQDLLDEHEDGVLDSLSIRQQKPAQAARRIARALGHSSAPSKSRLPRLPSWCSLRQRGIWKAERRSHLASSATSSNLRRQAAMNGGMLAQQDRMTPSSLSRAATCTNLAEQLAAANIAAPSLPRSSSTFSLPTVDAEGDTATQTEPAKDPRGRFADPDLTLDQAMSHIHERIAFASTSFSGLANKVESSLLKFARNAARDQNHQVRILCRELASIALVLRDGRLDWDMIHGMTDEFFFCVLPKLEAILSSLYQLVRYSCMRWMQDKVLEPCEAIERRLRRIQDQRRVLAQQAEDDLLEKKLMDALNEERGDRDGDLSMDQGFDFGNQAAPMANYGVKYHTTMDDVMDEEL